MLLRQALDNSTANFRSGQWEAIEELLEELNKGRVRKINRPIAFVVNQPTTQISLL
ncbi:hypothetical protein [Nostoc sp. UCD121]|uniref:hypothetical protein n=1 Tax=Nostoc sp. UCD121 TaxID=2681305 RepID=UPI001628A208|nr:hypothetical protein [Nostoc sp. UCD121]MBC1219452.1 hypothetical protein [Nostoc sp. UCD120]